LELLRSGAMLARVVEPIEDQVVTGAGQRGRVRVQARERDAHPTAEGAVGTVGEKARDDVARHRQGNDRRRLARRVEAQRERARRAPGAMQSSGEDDARAPSIGEATPY